jgi:hypothetical protein
VARAAPLVTAAVVAGLVPMGEASRHLLGVAVLLSLSTVALVTTRGLRTRLSVAALAGAAILLPRLPPALTPIMMGALVACLEVRTTTLRSWLRVVPKGTGTALLSFGLLNLVLQLVPHAERVLDSWLRAFTHLFGPPELGWTASACAWFALAELAVLSAPAQSRRVRSARAGLVAIAYVALLPLIAAGIRHDVDQPFWPGTIAGVALIFIASAVVPTDEGRLEPRGRVVPAISLACVVLAAVALLRVDLWSAPRLPKTANILVVNEGGLDWERPRFGKFDAFDGGMFGLLPFYLRASGFSIATAQGEVPSAGELENTDVLVLINNPRKWTADERAMIEGYVRRGGSLLVLGDHTNVFGLQEGFNTLLRPLGISFRFDSAYHIRDGWHGCLSSVPPRFTVGLDESSLGHAIGASLETAGAAFPLASSGFAFSDAGNPDNHMGSYLGDYRFELDERLGDVDLVAARFLGRGKVVVYGDTSAFQNASLPSTYVPHLLRLMRWLARPVAIQETLAVRLVVAAALLAALLFLLVARRQVRAEPVLIALLLTIVPAPREQAPFEDLHDVVWVDLSKQPRVGHYDAGRNPIYPLLTNFARSGLLPVWKSEPGFEGLHDSRALVMVAPASPLGERETEALVRYMQDGGVVIVAANAADACEVDPLLRSVGLALEPVPLGTFPIRRGRDTDDGMPRLLDASPIRDLLDPAAPSTSGLGELRALVAQGGFTGIAYRKVRVGGLLLIGDTRFFSARNIENDSGVHEGNVVLLYRIAKDLLGANPDDILCAFDSPKKP